MVNGLSQNTDASELLSGFGLTYHDDALSAEDASLNEEQKEKLERAQEILGYTFKNKHLLLSAITHPSATEGKAVKFSYERLEFLGDSILGAIVATIAFDRFHELDEGGLTRIKVALVSGSSL